MAIVFGVICHGTLMEVGVVFAIVTDGGRQTVLACYGDAHPQQDLREVLWVDVTDCTQYIIY